MHARRAAISSFDDRGSSLFNRVDIGIALLNEAPMFKTKIIRPLGTGYRSIFPHISLLFSPLLRPHFKTLGLWCDAVRRSRLYSRQRTRCLHFTTRTLLAFYGMYHATRASMLAPYLFVISRTRDGKKRNRKRGRSIYSAAEASRASRKIRISSPSQERTFPRIAHNPTIIRRYAIFSNTKL